MPVLAGQRLRRARAARRTSRRRSHRGRDRAVLRTAEPHVTVPTTSVGLDSSCIGGASGFDNPMHGLLSNGPVGVAGVGRLGEPEEQVTLRVLAEPGGDRLELVGHALEDLDRRGGGDEALDHRPQRVGDAADLGPALRCVVVGRTIVPRARASVMPTPRRRSRRSAARGRTAAGPCGRCGRSAPTAIARRAACVASIEVDAHAEVLVEVAGAVVPPRVEPAVVVVTAEHVDEPPARASRERRRAPVRSRGSRRALPSGPTRRDPRARC